MSLRQHLESFAQNTSMHGFGKVFLTKKPSKRVAWLIIFLTAWTLFAYQLTSVLTKYFEYSKKTTTEFVAGGAPFPAITLCNMQSLDFYAIHKHMKSVEDYRRRRRNNKAEKFSGPNGSYTYHIAHLIDLSEKYRHRNKLSDYEEKELRYLFSRQTVAENLPQNILDEIVINQNEFIVKCKYGTSACSFKEIMHSYFLKCFTIEPPGISNRSFENFHSLSEGVANGLTVTVFTGTELTNKNFSEGWVAGVYEKGSPVAGSGGIRVVIHPPGTEPFPLTEGYDVPPGFQASMGIVPERRKRLGKPYGRCDTRNRYKFFGDDSEKTEPYRKISCQRMCMQYRVIEKCQCYDKTLPDIGETLCDDGFCLLFGRYATTSSGMYSHRVLTCRSIKSLEACALDDSCNASVIADTLKNIRCAGRVINKLMTDSEALSKCNCHAPCDEFRYEVSYSLAKWPSSGYEVGSVFEDIFVTEKFVDRFTAGQKQLYEEYLDRADIQPMKDFAKINVYVTDINVVQITEEPAITITQLISDIGGQLGLWIGVSMITLSEVLETTLTIAVAGFRKLCRKVKDRKGDSDNEVRKVEVAPTIV